MIKYLKKSFLLLVTLSFFSSCALSDESLQLHLRQLNGDLIEVSIVNATKNTIYIPVLFVAQNHYVEINFMGAEQPIYKGMEYDWRSSDWDNVRLLPKQGISQQILLKDWFNLKTENCYKIKAKYSAPVVDENLWSGVLSSNSLELCLKHH